MADFSASAAFSLIEVVLVSYCDELAQVHSCEARQPINEHTEYLGVRLSSNQDAVAYVWARVTVVSYCACGDCDGWVLTFIDSI